MTPSSKQIITEAHTRFNQLEDYGFDWSSFYNGYVAGRLAGLRPDCGVGITHYEGSHPACTAKAADPYAELKKAHAEGAVIQHRFSGHLPWNDTDKPEFLSSREYRIKPEPETFEAHGKTWIRHTPGDAMPCSNVRVDYLMRGRGGVTIPSSKPEFVIDIDWTADKDFESSEIIGWRYADEQPNPSVAGACAKCGCDVLHREGRAGEFDHECPKEIAEPETPWTPAVGDVVQLKSGGPKMTILSQSLNDDDEPFPDTWFCGWIDPTGNAQTWRKINSVCLTPVTE